MKSILICGMILLIAGRCVCSEMRVSGVRGSVFVRHNVQEDWVKVAVGDILKPDDSMKSGAHSSATILVEHGKRIVVPELVVVDIADFRTLTQEELLLKLAMERVRSVPPQQDRGTSPPRTTTMHGTNKNDFSNSPPHDSNIGTLELNGARFLHAQGYYATCVLRSMEVFRFHPELLVNADARIVIADALEKMHLRGESLSEYLDIMKDKLTPTQRATVRQSVSRLKKKESR